MSEKNIKHNWAMLYSFGNTVAKKKKKLKINTAYFKCPRDFMMSNCFYTDPYVI